MRRGDLLIAALTILESAVVTGVGFLDILTSDHATLRKINFSSRVPAPKARAVLNEIFEALREDVQDRDQVRNLLYRLRRDGLVVKTNRVAQLTLSPRGKEKLARLLQRLHAAPRYVPEKTKDVVIVAFDIPERERWKRLWLREALRNLGLRRLQQSLWVGNVKIPEVFISDLGAQRIIPYVEIFSVTKAGTIRQFT